MKKTHEKSRIYTVAGTAKLKNPEKVVLQIEATGQRNGDGFIYLVESVAAEDYDRTTAEGRAAAAEKELEEYKKEFSETTDNLNAEKEALEELLEQARDAGGNYRRKLDEAAQENAELRKALTECRRIFGELPPEIERLLNNEEGEKKQWLHLHNLEKLQKGFREILRSGSKRVSRQRETRRRRVLKRCIPKERRKLFFFRKRCILATVKQA